MKTLDREQTIDALVNAILQADAANRASDIFVDALVNGRTGFIDMPDDVLLDSCAQWDVRPVYTAPTARGTREKVYVQTVRLAIALPANEQNVEGALADAVNESLRELQRDFTPSSCILDYTVDEYSESDARADLYAEGAAFER